jgi:hypothetical protein
LLLLLAVAVSVPALLLAEVPALAVLWSDTAGLLLLLLAVVSVLLL